MYCFFSSSVFLVSLTLCCVSSRDNIFTFLFFSFSCCFHGYYGFPFCIKKIILSIIKERDAHRVNAGLAKLKEIHKRDNFSLFISLFLFFFFIFSFHIFLIHLFFLLNTFCVDSFYVVYSLYFLLSFALISLAAISLVSLLI